MLIQSPLNYTGGKYKLLKQITPLFPNDIETFVDLFCGGCNVGINIKANRYIYNDINKPLYSLYKVFKENNKDMIFEYLDNKINEYQLSKTSVYGYEYYGCDSSTGVGFYNKPYYEKLRKDLNSKKERDFSYYAGLYLLIVYAFNNQIRFNKKGEFNLPVGKRDFNNKMQEKLSLFIDKIKEQDNMFYNLDFRNFDTSKLQENDFIYIDPPYLITCATYNENGAWSIKDEMYLLDFIDFINSKNIRFALSNVLYSKGKKNDILENWINKNKYQTNYLTYNYSNSNWQTKDRTHSTQEVLITNYHIN